MKNNQFDLLRDKRFAPLFVVQFLGAFHDNVFKNALVALLLYGVVFSDVGDPKLLVTVAAGVLILPFIFLSGTAGQLADKYPKDKVIRAIKLAEIPVAILGVIALFSGSLTLSFIALFLLGAQSAFFAPSKYSILPDHLKEKELIGGNALLNTGTFLAILIGTLMGTLFITMEAGQLLVATIMVFSAVVGYLASRHIPTNVPKAPNLKINWNPITESVAIVQNVFKQKPVVFRSILGASWFYFLGAMFMAQFPSYTKEVLGADEGVLAFFLIIFSVGIGIGGLLNNKLLRGRVEAVYVPLAILGMTLFSIDLYFASPSVVAHEELLSLGAFLSMVMHWRILLDVFLIAVCGGLFVVPLNAMIQRYTEEKGRARVIAGSAILDAIFITSSMAICSALIILGWEIHELFLTFAFFNVFAAVYVCRLLPDYLAKSLMQGLFKFLYKVEVKGLENYEEAGPRAVIVCNHVALLDPPLLAAFLPGKPMFAVNSFVAEWPLVKPFLRLVDFFPLDPTNPYSIKSLIKEVEKDKHCVIFPEGRLTETGALMKVYEGPGMIADKAEAVILPVRLDGVQHTPFARLKGKVPLINFPKITITILPPLKFKIDDELKGRKRRAAAARQLYDVMEEMMYLTTDREQTLYEALIKAGYINGKKEVIAEDAEFKPLKFKKLMQGSLVLGKKFEAMSEKGENIGVLLPNSVGAVVTFFGLQAFGRVPAMLNFSAGPKAVCSACETAQVKTVLTSKRFIKLGRLESLTEALEEKVKIVYLEDIRKEITFTDKMYALIVSPASAHAACEVKPEDPAVILFTSGSEGAPKGVVLSHKNIMTNVVQLSARVDFNRQDIVFNCLPMFHSFGLTGGTLLPILSGIKTFLYPSPLHYRIVPELVYAANATIMFGTDTFLSGYARMANPYDFYRMRYIFAGAEKVKEETRQTYMDKFGVRILEGYGATETSPVIAVNSPMHQQAGSVGRLLSGLEFKLEDVPGVDEGGRLYVRGDNVMLGYYKNEKPGILEPPVEGWHDTGDIVDIDENGFVKILGRAKRFAKIAGEMVSLSSVEAMVTKVYLDQSHAVVSIPDARKGEQLVLVTTAQDAKKEELSAYASKNGISELSVPKNIKIIDKLPVLGSGKTDYTSIQKMVAPND